MTDKALLKAAPSGLNSKEICARDLQKALPVQVPDAKDIAAGATVMTHQALL